MASQLSRIVVDQTVVGAVDGVEVSKVKIIMVMSGGGGMFVKLFNFLKWWKISSLGDLAWVG